MSTILEKHKALTAVRAKAFENLVGCPPSSVFPPHSLFKKPDERFLIDVFVYTLGTESGDIEAAVTKGLSDQRMPHTIWTGMIRLLLEYGHDRNLCDLHGD